MSVRRIVIVCHEGFQTMNHCTEYMNTDNNSI